MARAYQVVVREKVPRKSLIKKVSEFNDRTEAWAFYKAEGNRLLDSFEAKNLVNFKIEFIGPQFPNSASRDYFQMVGKDTWSYNDPEVDLGSKAEPKDDAEEADQDG